MGNTIDRRSGHRKRIVALTLLIIAATCLSLTAGCGKQQKYPPAVLFSALDASASGANALKGNRLLLARCGAGLGPEDTFVLYGIDHATCQTYNNQPHRSQEDALRLLRNAFPRASDRPGTYPERFFTEAANPAHHLPFVVLAAWDGENSDQSARSFNAIQSAAHSLARNPRCLGVLIYGVKKENQGEFQREFHPLEQAGKLHCWPDSDRRPLAVLERIDTLRRNASERLVAARTP